MNPKFRRVLSLVMAVDLLASLLAPTALAQMQGVPGYNPYQGVGQGQFGGRYDRQYGNRYDPNYYQPGGIGYQGGYGLTNMVPQLVGAVLGLAMGAKFGVVGAVLGGAVGFFGGKAISSSLFGDNFYASQYDYQPQHGGGASSMIPGALGAAIGAFMGSSFGFIGMAVGAGMGFLVAKAIARMLFPNVYYSGYGPLPGGNGGGYFNPYGSADAGASATIGQQAPLASSSAEDGSLAELKQRFYDSMRTYKGALDGSDEGAKQTARQAFLAAQKSYLDAKHKGGQE